MSMLAVTGGWPPRPVDCPRHRRAVAGLTAAVLGLHASMAVASDSLTPWLQDAAGVRIAQAQADQAFDIPPQRLDAALRRFAEQTGLQLAYTSAKVTGLRTPGVQGTYTPEAALRRLLAGTGLDYRFTDPDTVVLERTVAEERQSDPATLPPITVEGTAESPYGPVDGYKAQRSTTATRLDLAIEDTPAAIQVIPRGIIEDTGADRVADTLDYTAGVQETNSFGNTSDNFLVRGFNATFAEDGSVSAGANADVQVQRDSATVERVEVLRGPVAALYGEGSPGGIVNVITKRPREETFVTGDSVLSSFERYRQEFDANTTLGAEQQVRLRLSGALEASDSFRDEVDGDRQVVAPAVTFAPNERLRLAYRGEYLRDSEEFDRGVPIDANGGPLAGEEAFFGDPDDGNVETETGRNQLEVAYDISEAWTGRLFGSWTYNSLQGRATDPIAISPIDLPPLGLRANDTVLRASRERHFETNVFTGRAELTGDVTTALIGHKILLSFEAREIQDNTDFAQTSLFAQPNLVSISDRRIDRPDPEPTEISNNRNDVTNYGLVAFDQISPWEPVNILVGGRLDFVDQRARLITNSGETSDETDETEFSPTVGVVVSPFPWGSVFFRYAQSFQVNTANGPQGEVIAPQEGESFEAGVRANLFDGDLSATVTVFDIELDNVPVADAFGNFSRPTDQESQGVEFSLQGQVSKAFSVVANYTFTDAEILELPNLEESSDVAGVPEHEASLFANYEFQEQPLAGFSVNAGAIFTGERLNAVRQLVNTPLPQGAVPLGGKELDSFVRVDIGASYAIDDWLSASFKIENLFDEEYERPSRPDFALPGAPRTYVGRVSLRF